MTVHHKPVFSSNISTIGYDDAVGELHVTYKSGRVSVYDSVPPSTAKKVTGAVSIGKALHQHVIGRYPHRYAEGG